MRLMSEKHREDLRHASAARRRRDGAERMQAVATLSISRTVPKEGGQHAAGVRALRGPTRCSEHARRP